MPIYDRHILRIYLAFLNYYSTIPCRPFLEDERSCTYGLYDDIGLLLSGQCFKIDSCVVPLESLR